MFTEMDGKKIKMHLRAWNSLKEQNPGLSEGNFLALAQKKIGDHHVMYILHDRNMNALMSRVQH